MARNQFIQKKRNYYILTAKTPPKESQILFDELSQHGLSWDDQILVAAGVSDPMAILDFAEWLADHRDATKQEMMKEKIRLIEKYEIDI